MAKTYDPQLVQRINELKDGLEPQVLGQLWSLDVGLRSPEAAKYRRILSGKAYKGDTPYIERMEEAKDALMEARKKLEARRK